MRRKNKFDWILISIFSLFILLNILGFIVEGLFTLGIVETDVANIRGWGFVSVIFSLAFIISGSLFVYYYYRLRSSTILWWNIFMGTGLVITLHKFIRPTILSSLVPFYNYILLVVVIAIWFLLFVYLRRKNLD